MKKINKVVVLSEILRKYPLLEETIKRTYEGVKVFECDDHAIIGFIGRNMKDGDVWAIVTDTKFLPIDIFSNVESLYKRFGKGISSLVLIEPEVIDNDIAYDFYFSSFTEIRIKKTFFGKRSFRIEYENTVSKYTTDFFPSER